MSIQSEISRISREVTTQTDLLGQIAAELAGKAAGGDIKIQTDKEAVTPSNVAQTVWPDSGYDALAKVTVNGDANLLPANIKSGVQIFGVSGTYAGSGGTAQPVLQEKIVTPSADGSTVAPDSGYDGLSAVYVRGDADLVASNIKLGVNIFGVTGTYTGSGTSGLPEGISALASGVLTPETDIAEMYELQHNLGVEPNFLTIMLMDTLSEVVPNMVISGTAQMKRGLPEPSNYITIYHYGETGSGINTKTGAIYFTESTSYIFPLASSSALKAGYSYRWVCGVMDGIG